MPIELLNVVVPDSPLCVAAMRYAQRVSERFLFNHVMRTYAFGEHIGRNGPAHYDSELLFIGAVLHDLGLTESVPVRSRFEIDGADAASEFLSRAGLSDRDVQTVWDAIALHTTYGIPQRKQPEIALVQTGAGVDVGVIPLTVLRGGFLEQVLDLWPRLGFKSAMVAALRTQFDKDVGSAASPAVSDVAVRRIDGFEPVNLCDLICNSGFSE